MGTPVTERVNMIGRGILTIEQSCPPVALVQRNQNSREHGAGRLQLQSLSKEKIFRVRLGLTLRTTLKRRNAQANGFLAKIAGPFSVKHLYLFQRKTELSRK